MVVSFLRRHGIKFVALFCFILFLSYFFRVDGRRALTLLKQLSWVQLLILIVLRLVFLFLRTLNWKTVLNSRRNSISWKRLYTAYLAGNAVGFLTPAGRLGGDGFRAVFVREGRRSEVIASIVIEKTLEYIATLCIMSAGLLAALVLIPMPVSQGLFFILLIVIVAGLIAIFFWLQKKGLFKGGITLLNKTKFRIFNLEENHLGIEHADTFIKDFYRHHRLAVAAVIFFSLMLFSVWILEIHLTLSFIGTPDLTLTRSCLLVILGNFANLVPGLPGGLGIYEITYVSLFSLLGFVLEYGLALIILRRALGIGLAGIGLIPLATRKFMRRGDTVV